MKKKLAGATALAIGDMLADVQVAERALFRVCADDERRQAVALTDAEQNAVFAAWHALKTVQLLLWARDPWKEKAK